MVLLLPPFLVTTPQAATLTPPRGLVDPDEGGGLLIGKSPLAHCSP